MHPALKTSIPPGHPGTLFFCIVCPAGRDVKPQGSDFSDPPGQASRGAYSGSVSSIPFFSKNRNHIGMFSEDRPNRKRPYGERRMAASTIGGVFPTDTFRIVNGVRRNMKGHGRNGLEQTFDSLLNGEPGIGFTQKVKLYRQTIVQREPVDGADVYTTLDMEMQRILDFELNKRILELNAAGGWAAVMETKTGKIKAISNLQRRGDYCVEDYNHFVMDLYDPGSTFKTVSYTVLLDDGKITPDTEVDTGNTHDHPSSWNYHGKEIRDDHPVGKVTADEAMVQSSNISLAKLTTGAYDRNPQRYLDLIDKMKIFEDLHLNVEFQGAQRPRNRKVGDATWSRVSLGQISYGQPTAERPKQEQCCIAFTVYLPLFFFSFDVPAFSFVHMANRSGRML